MRLCSKHHKCVLKAYRRTIKTNHQYPFLRHEIADAKCFIAVENRDPDSLIRWQDRRTEYYNRLIKLRPRNNEFFSY